MEPQLPSFYELLNRFSLFDSSTSCRCDVQIGSNGSVFCSCEGCARWRDFVEGRDPCDAHVQYEVFTREHITGLACYLRARAAEYNLPTMEVLEVGAGSGRLSQHLNRFLSKLLNENQGLFFGRANNRVLPFVGFTFSLGVFPGPVVRVIATDSGARGLNGPAVKEEDAIHAITTRKPHIIISSWMPRGIDWTAHMRAEQSVHEYILIGETDNGICGCPWQTWGCSSAWDWSDSDDSDSENINLLPTASCDSIDKVLDHSSESRLAEFQRDEVIPTNNDQSEVASSIESDSLMRRTPAESEENQACRRGRPQYQRDGWERVELDSLSRVQLCRTDERWSTNRHSHTVSFRKKPRLEN